MPTKNIFDLRIRTMTNQHYKEVAEIDQLTAFGEDLLCDEAMNGIPDNVKSRVIVDPEGSVLGFAMYFDGPTYAECNVVRFAVHPSTQRRGIGWKMMEYIKCSYHQIDVLVHDDRYEAMSFLSEQKFEVRQVLKSAEAVLFRWIRKGAE